MNTGYPNYIEIREMESSKQNVIKKLEKISKAKTFDNFLNSVNDVYEDEIEELELNTLNKKLKGTPSEKIIDFLNSKLKDTNRTETMYDLIGKIIKGDESDFEKLLENVKNKKEKKELLEAFNSLNNDYKIGERKFKKSGNYGKANELKLFLQYSDYYNAKDNINISPTNKKTFNEDINNKYKDLITKVDNNVPISNLFDIMKKNMGKFPNVFIEKKDKKEKVNLTGLMDLMTVLTFNEKSANLNDLRFIKNIFSKNIYLIEALKQNYIKTEGLHNDYFSNPEYENSFKQRFIYNKMDNNITQTLTTLKSIFLNQKIDSEIKESFIEIQNQIKTFFKDNNINLKNFIEARESEGRNTNFEISPSRFYSKKSIEEKKSNIIKTTYSIDYYKKELLRETNNTTKERLKTRIEEKTEKLNEISDKSTNRIIFLTDMKKELILIINEKLKELEKTKPTVRMPEVYKELEKNLKFNVIEEYITLLNTNDIKLIEKNPLIKYIEEKKKEENIKIVHSTYLNRINDLDLLKDTTDIKKIESLPYKNKIKLNETNKNSIKNLLNDLGNLEIKDKKNVIEFKDKLFFIIEEIAKYKETYPKSPKIRNFKEVTEKLELLLGNVNLDLKQKIPEETLVEKIKKVQSIDLNF